MTAWRIAPGAAGDLTVFALDELQYETERLVGDMPGGARRFTRPSGGYRATVVAGCMTQCDGSPTGATPGRDAALRPVGDTSSLVELTRRRHPL